MHLGRTKQDGCLGRQRKLPLTQTPGIINQEVALVTSADNLGLFVGVARAVTSAVVCKTRPLCTWWGRNVVSGLKFWWLDSFFMPYDPTQSKDINICFSILPAVLFEIQHNTQINFIFPNLDQQTNPLSPTHYILTNHSRNMHPRVWHVKIAVSRRWQT